MVKANEWDFSDKDKTSVNPFVEKLLTPTEDIDDEVLEMQLVLFGRDAYNMIHFVGSTLMMFKNLGIDVTDDMFKGSPVGTATKLMDAMRDNDTMYEGPAGTFMRAIVSPDELGNMFEDFFGTNWDFEPDVVEGEFEQKENDGNE